MRAYTPSIFVPRRCDAQAVQPIDRLARSRERKTLVTPRQHTERPFANATRIALSLRRSERVNKKTKKTKSERDEHGDSLSTPRRGTSSSPRAQRVRRAAPRLSRDAPRRETPAGLATTPRPATPSLCSSPKAPQVAIASQTAKPRHAATDSPSRKQFVGPDRVPPSMRRAGGGSSHPDSG